MFDVRPVPPRLMSFRPFLFVSAVLFAVVGPARAQMLWPGTVSGMSVEQVQSIFPAAHAPETPMQLPNDRGESLLQLDETVIAGHAFQVLFFFKGRQLVQVALVETGDIPVKEFEKFRQLLRGKYGLEYSTRSSEYIQVTWKAVQTVILLTWTPQGRGISTLSLTYEAPILKETYRL